MSAERWFECADDILTRVRTTQAAAIGAAAEAIAAAAAAGNGLHIYDTGHCSHEPIHRAGGLLMLRDFRIALSVTSTPAPKQAAAVAAAHAQTKGEADEHLARLAVLRSGFAAGDVLIVNSVSGKSPLPVEVARTAKEMGLTVVAITNVTYSESVASQHSSGKRLCEVADIVIDNCGVVGDAALDMEGLDTRAVPTSGLTFCYIIWALVAETIAKLQARGLTPHIWRSVNLPDGEAFNAKAEAEYRETGV